MPVYVRPYIWAGQHLCQAVYKAKEGDKRQGIRMEFQQDEPN